jgi:hypothetical protein
MPHPHYGQFPLRNWHFNTPYPMSGPMTRRERDFWLELVMKGAYLPAGPKEPVQQRRLAPPPLAIAGPVEQRGRRRA